MSSSETIHFLRFCLLTYPKISLHSSLTSGGRDDQEGGEPRAAPAEHPGCGKRERPPSQGLKPGKSGLAIGFVVLRARLTVGRPALPQRKSRSESEALNWQPSGPTPPARGAGPDQEPRDRAAKQMTTQANIAESALFFQSPASGRSTVMDRAHEHPSSRQTN